MSNFHDKKTFIFPYACNLLTVLSSDDVIRKVGEAFCFSMNMCYHVTATSTTLARQKMCYFHQAGFVIDSC